MNYYTQYEWNRIDVQDKLDLYFEQEVTEIQIDGDDYVFDRDDYEWVPKQIDCPSCGSIQEWCNICQVHSCSYDCEACQCS